MSDVNIYDYYQTNLALNNTLCKLLEERLNEDWTDDQWKANAKEQLSQYGEELAEYLVSMDCNEPGA